MLNFNMLPFPEKSGPDTDVIISCKARLVRNLANFPFSDRLSLQEKEQVRSIIFDAFNRIQDEDIKNDAQNPLTFSMRALDDSDDSLKNFLFSCGIISSSKKENGVLLCDSGFFGAGVNGKNHLKLFTAKTGRAEKDCFDGAYTLDRRLQKIIQFAASSEHGYLAHNLEDTGTGLCLSAVIHIPCTVRKGELSSVQDFLKACHITLEPAFTQTPDGFVPGHFYIIRSEPQFYGNEFELFADFSAACTVITETERKILHNSADNKRTVMRNYAIHACSVARTALLLSYGESLTVISEALTALEQGLICGIDGGLLCRLLFMMSSGYLTWLFRNGNFNLEDDIRSDEKVCVERLRALLINDAFKNVSLGNV